jgi:putative aldouronate transport system permease protein
MVRKESSLGKHIKQHAMLYMMVTPGVIYLIAFWVIPILGNFIAFMDYNYIMGISYSKWVGFKHFKILFNYSEFYRILRNTMVIGLYNLLFKYPAPLILALILNEIRVKWFKSTSQTLIFIPYFLSWIIVARLTYSILDPDSGMVNIYLKALGFEPYYFMIKAHIFPVLVSLTGVWRDSGFACIVYLAALTAIDPQLYEAAKIDGANKFQQIVHITIPMLVPTMLVLLLVNIGQFLNTGFNQIYGLYNPLVRDTGEILINYTYVKGINQGEFSFATAVGVFQALVGAVLVISGNKLSLKLTGRGLFYVQRKEKK